MSIPAGAALNSSTSPLLCRPAVCLVLCLAVCAGCDETAPSNGRLDLVWGRRGVSDGRLQKPRAMAIDAQDRLYIVDMTARIQVFTPDGDFLRGWQTPAQENGRPTGLSIGRQGRVLVADTHYYQVLIYSPEGELLQKIGGQKGHAPGEFGFVTCAIEDALGNLYVSEYGEYDRIQKFSPDGKFLLQWGGHGSAPGQFVRPQKMVIDGQGHIWVCDACNHRIQIFDDQGRLLRLWGTGGSEPGQLYYPYDLALDGQGHVYVCEYGNHRVQKFTTDGESLGCWGHQGRKLPGELHNPWALVRDSQGRIHVLDTNNHRVQRIVM
jgi:NHL repeat-containing protein